MDIRTQAGKQILWRLIESADVLVENFRPGTMARLGFGFEQVHARYPTLVYCSISGFGQTGPYRERGGFDLVAQAMSGLLSVTGSPEEPAKVGVPIGDLNAGLYASHAILAALLSRVRTGEGQYIDTSLLEAALSYTMWESNEYWATGKSPQRLGTAHRLAAPYQVFETASGWIAIGAANQRNWELLVRALDRPDLLQHAAFATNADRMANLAQLVETLTAILKTRTTEEWSQVFDEAGVPSGPVLALSEVYQHPHVQARAMDIQVQHPIAGSIHMIGFPVKYSSTPEQMYRPAPVLGQHTCAMLERLGFSPEQCRQFETDRVILDAHMSEQ